ncbi:Flp pilus assembly complex ATPase component TadA [Subtercola sp. PAMC28395]|uniref:CpaF family protein n=1 Tax=Subtercola sp. PAMC28395 TaxID=2846775 RepID=UPI001C0B2D0E|nr:ATPase, T2SS/T4P/T4SS family [Subtercola sp. PAMC28395]QWT24916.1 Flp pilus assembly complex ATPase component TadA [Subtercola sp. PAMC28395]
MNQFLDAVSPFPVVGGRPDLPTARYVARRRLSGGESAVVRRVPESATAHVQLPPSSSEEIGRGETATESTAPPPRTGSADFGPLARFLNDESVTDIFINGPNDLWIDRGSGLSRDESWSCPGEAELRQLAVRLIALGGRHIDESTPCVDTRLHDGIRVHAVLPPVAPRGTVISLRVPSVARLRIPDLFHSGFFDAAVAECGIPASSAPSSAQSSAPSSAQLRHFVEECVGRRSNILISGAGGSGKTTFLAALLAEAPPHERIVAIEDVAELRVEHEHFVALEARQSNVEGAGGIGLDRLLREALRMRPDRLVLGECRGAEVRELFSALNTGHDGGAGTLHANSLADVPARLEALGSLAGLTPEALARQAMSAIQVVFHLQRSNGNRRLAEVGHFELDAHDRLVIVREQIGTATLSPDQPGRASPVSRRIDWGRPARVHGLGVGHERSALKAGRHA